MLIHHLKLLFSFRKHAIVHPRRRTLAASSNSEVLTRKQEEKYSPGVGKIKSQTPVAIIKKRLGVDSTNNGTLACTIPWGYGRRLVNLFLCFSEWHCPFTSRLRLGDTSEWHLEWRFNVVAMWRRHSSPRSSLDRLHKHSRRLWSLQSYRSWSSRWVARVLCRVSNDWRCRSRRLRLRCRLRWFYFLSCLTSLSMWVCGTLWVTIWKHETINLETRIHINFYTQAKSIAKDISYSFKVTRRRDGEVHKESLASSETSSA